MRACIVGTQNRQKPITSLCGRLERRYLGTLARGGTRARSPLLCPVVVGCRPPCHCPHHRRWRPSPIFSLSSEERTSLAASHCQAVHRRGDAPPPLTVEQRRHVHRRRVLHPAAPRNSLPLHTPACSPEPRAPRAAVHHSNELYLACSLIEIRRVRIHWVGVENTKKGRCRSSDQVEETRWTPHRRGRTPCLASRTCTGTCDGATSSRPESPSPASLPSGQNVREWSCHKLRRHRHARHVRAALECVSTLLCTLVMTVAVP